MSNLLGSICDANFLIKAIRFVAFKSGTSSPLAAFSIRGCTAVTAPGNLGLCLVGFFGIDIVPKLILSMYDSKSESTL